MVVLVQQRSEKDSKQSARDQHEARYNSPFPFTKNVGPFVILPWTGTSTCRPCRNVAAIVSANIPPNAAFPNCSRPLSRHGPAIC